MSQNAFRAGIEPGGLTSSREIKTLLCFLIAKYNKPVPHSVLVTSLTFVGIVNYFDCTDSLGDLTDSNLIVEEDEGYTITTTGKYIADTLFGDIPISVRERATESTRRSMLLHYNAKQHNTLIEKTDDGFLVHCSLNDTSYSIFSLSLYAPTSVYAQRIERNFILNAQSIIETVISKMTSETEF